ncbi:MAG: hypothetical protein P8L78_08310 [Mariniblastus sp.]|nr:hypothetical protein [Mariniblastus sp.]
MLTFAALSGVLSTFWLLEKSERPGRSWITVGSRTGRSSTDFDFVSGAGSVATSWHIDEFWLNADQLTSIIKNNMIFIRNERICISIVCPT